MPFWKDPFYRLLVLCPLDSTLRSLQKWSTECGWLALAVFYYVPRFTNNTAGEIGNEREPNKPANCSWFQVIGHKPNTNLEVRVACKISPHDYLWVYNGWYLKRMHSFFSLKEFKHWTDQPLWSLWMSMLLIFYGLGVGLGEESKRVNSIDMHPGAFKLRQYCPTSHAIDGRLLSENRALAQSSSHFEPGANGTHKILPERM